MGSKDLEFSKQYLAYQEKALDYGYTHFTISLENMANLYKKMGKNEEAEKYEKQAQAIRDKRTEEKRHQGQTG